MFGKSPKHHDGNMNPPVASGLLPMHKLSPVFVANVGRPTTMALRTTHGARTIKALAVTTARSRIGCSIRRRQRQTTNASAGTTIKPTGRTRPAKPRTTPAATRRLKRGALVIGRATSSASAPARSAMKTVSVNAGAVL